MNVVAVVIARGGSKGIPNKNLNAIGGIPLVAYKIISAQRSKHVSRVILSSDSVEIQEIGRQFGAEIPFTRPSELSNDTASSDEVALHAMEWIIREENRNYDALLLLEPSTPFALAKDYDEAVEIMERAHAKMVVGMVEHKVNRVFIGEIDARNSISQIVMQMDSLRRFDRQGQNRNFTMNGGFYLLEWNHFLKSRRRYADPKHSYGIIMDNFRSVEIDNPIDLAWAEFLIDKKMIDLSCWQ